MHSHYCEGAARLRIGAGFFRADSRPARDIGVLLLRWLAQQRGPQASLSVLDGLAGCGIRSLRYGLEAGASEICTNDADPLRLPQLEENLAPLAAACRLELTSQTIQKLLALCLLQQRRFDLVDLDAFGASTQLLPLALEAVSLGGILYVASSDGRSFTGHDRRAALRRLGAAARAQPCSWELALRLQLGAIARAAWVLGRGVRPLLSLSEGRTFRTAVQVLRSPAPGEEAQLGLQAYCHSCGNHWGQSLLHWRGLGVCPCGGDPVCSGPLWRGPLQNTAVLSAALGLDTATLGAGGHRLLARLQADAGLPPEASAWADLGRCLGGGPPPQQSMLSLLHQQGWQALASAIQPGQFRTDAPWQEVLRLAPEAR
jgi:tRNA (guanine26-N2/guanine27-N2)-dimethyltransferase